MLHCCCEFSGNDECGIRNKNATSMTGDEVRTLINESFDVFQLFLKIKMQMGGVGNEDMIEESINASKCYMLENEHDTRAGCCGVRVRGCAEIWDRNLGQQTHRQRCLWKLLRNLKIIEKYVLPIHVFSILNLLKH